MKTFLTIFAIVSILYLVMLFSALAAGKRADQQNDTNNDQEKK